MFYLYVSPDKQAAFLEMASEIRRLFASNNVEAGYRVYKSGYGNSENYFIIEVTPEDAKRIASFNDEFKEYRYELFQHILRTEVFNVTLRDDLSYQ